MNIISQPYEILGCVYFGIISGIVYGISDDLRRLLGSGVFMTCICDGLYVAVTFIGTVVFMYMLTYGRFEPYHLISILAGIFLYTRNVHKLFLHLTHLN